MNNHLEAIRHDRAVRKETYREIAALLCRWAQEASENQTIMRYELNRAAYDILGEIDEPPGHGAILCEYAESGGGVED